MDARALLAAPRGRRLCWHLFGLDGCGLTDRTLPAARAQQPAVLEQLRPDDATTEELVHEALIFAVDVARYWQPPDPIDKFLEAAEPLALLGPVAEAVLACAAVRSWHSPLVPEDQWIVSFGDDDREPRRPEPSAVQARLQRWAEAERRAQPGSQWWSTPDRWDVVVTSPRDPRRGLVGLRLIEDYLGWPLAASWPVRPSRGPRTFEITGPSSWAALARRYPMRAAPGRAGYWEMVTGHAGEWVLPDWAGVSTEFDAVHLTVAGYLATAGVSVSVDQGRVALLAGWAPDETYWLTDDAVAVAGPRQNWVEHGRDQQLGRLGWRPAG